MSHLIDEQGNVYEQGLGGGWHPQRGLFGQDKDTNLLGQPNLQRDILGRPVEARGFWGSQQRSTDGRTLYVPSSSSFSAPSSSAGDALAGAAAFVLVILAFLALGALLSVAMKLAQALWDAWQTMHRRYPRLMVALKLGMTMATAWSVLYLAGFGWQVQASATLLVPGLWGWLWLTRHVPLVFMPINASFMGAILWLAATLRRQTWQPTWSRLVEGLPLTGDLPLLLASLPMVALLWRTGVRKWPRPFRPANALAAGVLLWFVLMRVWTGWQGAWEWWTGPLPQLHAITGWTILFLPLALWLWLEGWSRWPYPFTGMNLLLLGGVLSLSAYHSQATWLPTWHQWMSGLPFVAFPFLSISLAPFTMWSWAKLTQRWHRQLAIPNALITGAILFLLADRTRSWWSDAWASLWGPVPKLFDPAVFLLVLPVAGLAWRKGIEICPQRAWIGRSLLLGSMLWWLAERSRPLWQLQWVSLHVVGHIDLPLATGLTPLVLRTWRGLRHRWPGAVGAISLAVLVPLLWLVTGWLLPAEVSFRVGYTVLPLVTAAFLWLMGRRPIVVVAGGLLAIAAIGVAAIAIPEKALAALVAILAWSARQVLPAP
jgi:hypothetical protein